MTQRSAFLPLVAVFVAFLIAGDVAAFGTIKHQQQHVAFRSTSSGSSLGPSPSTTALSMSEFAAEIRRRLDWKNTNAAKSNAIYMNPATTKIANIEISWEPDMALKIEEMQKQRELQGITTPLMIGVVGIPGSGKSTSCEILASLLDDAIVMPMDGYHYPLSVLEAFPNPVDAIYRRGAPDTFDPASLERDLGRIVHGDESKVSIPGFDHARGDPETDSHTFVRDDHKIVVCEGIYLMHDSDGWDNIKDFFDFTIYIIADIDVCVNRLKERNKCIPGYKPEEIELRCDAVDRVNARLAELSRRYASAEVWSSASGVVQECDIEGMDIEEMIKEAELDGTIKA